jgi:hypothetical protein
MPFSYIRLRLEPHTPNLTPEECYLVPVVSRTHLRLFWAFSHFVYVDWNRTDLAGKLEWTFSEAALKDVSALDAMFASILTQFSRFVEEPLLAKWGDVATTEKKTATNNNSEGIQTDSTITPR